VWVRTFMDMVVVHAAVQFAAPLIIVDSSSCSASFACAGLRWAISTHGQTGQTHGVTHG